VRGEGIGLDWEVRRLWTAMEYPGVDLGIRWVMHIGRDECGVYGVTGWGNMHGIDGEVLS
jgi:hypothetical protein